MRCEELTNDVLLDYADRLLAKYDLERIGRHLEFCRRCRGRADDMRAMSAALGLAAPPCPTALLDQLDESVLAGFPGARRLRSWPRVVAGAAAAILVAFVLSFWLNQTRDPRPLASRADTMPRPSSPSAARSPAPLALQGAPVRASNSEPANPTISHAPSSPPVLPGDVNGDGRVDIADARIIQQALVRGETMSDRADANGDGTVDVADVRAITLREILAR